MTTAPAELSASRASPTGVSGESAVASTTAPAAPAAPMMAARARPTATNCRGRKPAADSGQPVVLLGDELPGSGLPDDSQPGEGGQARQHPPAHRLRPDRTLHGGGVDVEVIGAERIQRTELAIEGGQVSRTVPEPYVVERHHLCMRIHGCRERLRREQVVARPVPGGELILGHHEAHHPETVPRDGRQVEPWWGLSFCPSCTCAGVGVRTWMTEPICTPLSLASV